MPEFMQVRYIYIVFMGCSATDLIQKKLAKTGFLPDLKHNF
jgi:hypothetical protein